MFLEQTKDRKFSLTPTKVLRLLQRHDSAPDTLPRIVSRDSKGRLLSDGGGPLTVCQRLGALKLLKNLRHR